MESIGAEFSTAKPDLEQLTQKTMQTTTDSKIETAENITQFDKQLAQTLTSLSRRLSREQFQCEFEKRLESLSQLQIGNNHN